MGTPGRAHVLSGPQGHTMIHQPEADTAPMPNRFTSMALRMLWPAPILGFTYWLASAADDPFKLLLSLIGLVVMLALLQLLVVLLARRFDLILWVLGALALLTLAGFFAIAMLMAGFAPHGPDISTTAVQKSHLVSLAFAYPALLFLATSVRRLFDGPSKADDGE